MSPTAGSTSTRRVQRAVVAIDATIIISVAAGCGDDDGASAGSTPSQVSADATTPEERQVPDAEVTAGLNAMKPLVAAAAAAASSGGAAAGAFDPIEAKWRTFEGTVRTKEQDLYLAIEDGFASLQNALAAKDAAAAAKAQQAIDDAVAQYLAKHP